MAMDLNLVKSSLPVAVPMVATLNMEFVDLDYTTAVLRLPDQQAFHNHVAGPHAGAMFTLGESASGALVLANFGDLLGEATPLAVEAKIRYLKLAMGDLTATATISRDAADVIAELQSGNRPDFEVEIEFRTADDIVTGAMTVVWTLKPNRKKG